jgi:hypothetical protein
LRKTGIVASGSTVIDATVILNAGEEKNARAEDLVIIDNRNGNKIMAVCRTALGSKENLRAVGFSPGIAYARLGRHPSTAKEYYAFSLDVLGDISAEKLEQNKTVIAPSSDVVLFEVRFLSIEPLIGHIGTINLHGIHWVIVGGESGPNHRPINVQWAREVRDQCLAAGV